MTKTKTWKLTLSDNTVHEFLDIRRKVGNQIIRAYLLENIIGQNLVERMNGKMRGPKDEFKDFADFLVLTFQRNNQKFRILAESGVYENLRIVGTDNDVLDSFSADEIITLFTNALKEPKEYSARMILSEDSKVAKPS